MCPADCFASPPALPCKKEFRPVRRATKGAAFGLRRLLKKAGENFNVCFDNFCGDVSLCPPAKSQQSCFRVKKEKVKSHCLRVFAVRQPAPRFAARRRVHRGTPGEGSPRRNSPADCFASPPALPCKKEFRPVRRATKGAAFGLRRLLKKAGENFNVCFDNFCGDVSLCPPAKSQQSCFRVKKEKVKSHCLRVFAVRQRARAQKRDGKIRLFFLF